MDVQVAFHIIYILGGLLVVLLGGELLVRSSVSLARMLGISTLLISMTVVALGTSAPELAISVQSATQGKADMAVGNLLGSCMFNLLFILGLAAMISPLKTRKRMAALDIPMMIISVVMLWVFARDGNVSRYEGCIMLIMLAVFTIFRYFFDQEAARREKARLGISEGNMTESFVGHGVRRFFTSMIFLVLGLLFLVVGSSYAVDNCVELCKIVGVSELLIGLTVLAVGSSLPEMVVSCMASLKKESDLATGNVIGSNTMNILCVLALTAIIPAGGLNIPQAVVNSDILIVLFFSALSLPFFISGMTLSRLEGLLLVLSYVGYTIYIYLRSVQGV